MYGKHFENMYDGSMCGAGAIQFAVWGYIIAHAKFENIELNSGVVAFKIGCKKEEVESAIEVFCAPDLKSRNKEHEGKKLIKTGEYSYFVTGYKKYQAIKNEEDRRCYMREYMRSYRDRAVNNGVNSVNNVNKPLTMLAHIDTDTDPDKDTNKEKKKISPSGSAQKSADAHAVFESFWLKYPKKRDKARCLKVWNARKLDSKIDAILSGLEIEKKSSQWLKDQGEFIPHPSTWLNNERWESAKLQVEIKPVDFLEQVKELRRREGKTT